MHGRLDLLDRLLEEHSSSLAGRHLVFVGDLVDRGPQSRGVVERVVGLAARPAGATALLGNHEDMLLKALAGSEEWTATWIANGGRETLSSYGAPEASLLPAALPESHRALFEGMAHAAAAPGWAVAHAGVRPGRALEEQDPEDLVWIRAPFWTHPEPPLAGATVVFGHTPVWLIRDGWGHEPWRGPGMVGIDTGAVYGGRLTALLLPEQESVRVG